MAIALKQHDLDAVREGMTRWFRGRWPGHELSVGPLSRPSAGLSSDTLFVELARGTSTGSSTGSFVLRLPPAGDGLFPAYDLSVQARLQARLGELTDIPVAPVEAYEPDPGFTGTPFVLLHRVPGRVLANQPPYLQAGWLHDASPADQRRLYDGFFAVLDRLHSLDWKALGFDFVTGGQVIGLTHELQRWSDYLDWASDGTPMAELADALEWCGERRPDPEPRPALLWGDAQFQNCVFDATFGVAAVLDWELAGIGPAELDTGWFRALHRLTIDTVGSDLPGFPELDDDDGLRWYEVFAMVRSGAIMVRIAGLLKAQGVDDSWLTRGNPAIERLRTLT